MKKKNINGFTLVELLAVIVILAVILVIAVPQVLDVIDTTKVGSLESSAKLIANSAEKKYAEFLALGKDTSTIQCSDVTKLNDKDYGTCTISFDENGEATVLIKGKDDGKFEGLKCEGTKDNMVCGDIPPLPVINCTFTPSEEDIIETAKVYTVKDYDACMTNLRSTIIDEMGGTEDILNGICSGTGDGYRDSTSENIEWIIADNYFTEQELIDLNVINVEEIDVYEYVNGQYTYRYGQEYVEDDWYTIDNDGWGVTLSDKESTDPVASQVCTYINNKPIVSMSSMFDGSAASSIDLSSFNTSNVINMMFMFYGSKATSLDLSSFDTSKVTNMSDMFYDSAATSLDLSSFDTSNVINMMFMFSGSAVTSLDLSNFDTSKVTSMSSMFEESAATSIDLSSFDTSNVTNMSDMFNGSAATSLDLSSFDTSKVTNMRGMFVRSAATNLDLSNFDTSKVTNMSFMFTNSAATNLDLSNFDTSNVTSMHSMFWGSAAISLDLSSFDTSKVTDMSYMFQNSSATTGYARTQTDADKFNSSDGKPSTLTFVVKES